LKISTATRLLKGTALFCGTILPPFFLCCCYGPSLGIRTNTKGLEVLGYRETISPQDVSVHTRECNDLVVTKDGICLLVLRGPVHAPRELTLFRDGLGVLDYQCSSNGVSTCTYTVYASNGTMRAFYRDIDGDGCFDFCYDIRANSNIRLPVVMDIDETTER